MATTNPHVRTLLARVGCLHPPRSVTFTVDGTATCVDCGQRWIVGANSYEVTAWGRKANLR